jgi:hypothetical protein
MYAGAFTETLDEGGKLQVTRNSDVTILAGGALTGVQHCTAKITIGGTTRQVETTLSGGSSYPAFPDDYFTGGSPGSNGAAPCFTYSPDPPGAATVTLVFDASCTIGSGAKSWTWPGGSTGTDSTGSQAERTFPTNGTYNVTLTVTKAVSGITYTFTKKVVIGDPDTTEGDDASCGAFWHVVCYAELLFVPDTAGMSDDWGDVSDSAEDHYPAGPVMWGATAISDGVFGFKNGVNYGGTHATAGCDYGATWDLNGGAAGGNVSVPVIPGSGSDASCDPDTLDAYEAVGSISRPASAIAFYVFGGLFIWKLAVGAMGGGDGGDEE